LSDTTISRTLIVLPGQVWRAELEAELIRLGITEERAPISAGRVLSRICKHAGYLSCFLVDDAAELDRVKQPAETRGRPKKGAGNGAAPESQRRQATGAAPSLKSQED